MKCPVLALTLADCDTGLDVSGKHDTASAECPRTQTGAPRLGGVATCLLEDLGTFDCCTTSNCHHGRGRGGAVKGGTRIDRIKGGINEIREGKERRGE